MKTTLSLLLTGAAILFAACSPTPPPAEEKSPALPDGLVGTYRVDVSAIEATIAEYEKNMEEAPAEDKQGWADAIQMQEDDAELRRQVSYEIGDDGTWRMVSEGQETQKGKYSYADGVLTMHPDEEKNKELAEFNMQLEDALYDYNPEAGSLTLRGEDSKQLRLVKSPN